MRTGDRQDILLSPNLTDAEIGATLASALSWLHLRVQDLDARDQAVDQGAPAPEPAGGMLERRGE